MCFAHTVILDKAHFVEKGFVFSQSQTNFVPTQVVTDDFHVDVEPHWFFWDLFEEGFSQVHLTSRRVLGHLLGDSLHAH